MISMLVPAALGSVGLLLCAPTSGVGRLTTPRHRWVARLSELMVGWCVTTRTSWLLAAWWWGPSRWVSISPPWLPLFLPVVPR